MKYQVIATIGTLIIIGAIILLGISINKNLNRVIEKSMAIVEENKGILKEIDENSDSITFYLDGTEVSYDNIDILQYRVTYNREEKKCFLTHRHSKEESGLQLVPFFTPLKY